MAALVILPLEAQRRRFTSIRPTRHLKGRDPASVHRLPEGQV
jgi:hypothetical protein